MHRMKNGLWAVVLMSLGLSVQGRADGGEMTLRPVFDGGVTFSDYQREGLTRYGSPAMNPSLAFGFGIQYGLADWLSLELAPQVNLPIGNLEFANSSIEGFDGTLYARNTTLAAPVAVDYLLNQGFDISGRFGLFAGPALVMWQELAFSDPSIEGNPAIEVDKISPTRPGLMTGLRAELEWRPFDFLVLSFGGQGAAIYEGGMSWFVGAYVAPSFVFGLGPSF